MQYPDGYNIFNNRNNRSQYFLQMDLRYKSVTGRGFEIKLLFAGIHIADVRQTLAVSLQILKVMRSY